MMNISLAVSDDDTPVLLNIEIKRLSDERIRFEMLTSIGNLSKENDFRASISELELQNLKMEFESRTGTESETN
ncbi:unnamed protein product [Rotaria sordida]|uniref:Uncharacterized protein n=1 Tax=Rotaria sordida TaxID=392033 RepID=A0A819B569_9BILA|nr:unnamed protein product [Rotaria sordida]CAF1366090.1 unnamed protein product [Rotaria sordida]CAF3567179.1 unnamed protein product [Rotaria sordida]CAF3790937.1 unnamed protein product [Rotaria sordida]